jgi:adenylosuccinate lyase
LAKVVRGLVTPALENVVTWHERDLTQSSAERFIIPEACILVEYMIYLMINILRNLLVDKNRMRQNLKITKGRTMSESVMTGLIEKGMNRQEAHELLRKLTIDSERENRPFKEILSQNSGIQKFLTSKDIENALKPEKYLGTAITQVELMIKKTQHEREVRG